MKNCARGCKHLLMLVAMCVLLCLALPRAQAESSRLLLAQTRETPETQAAMDAKVEEIIAAEITEGMSSYEKALALHDWIIDNVVYQKIDDDSGTDYMASDAILLGRGVCQAYAMGYAELLNAVGINNAYEFGTDHIWNVIELNGHRYHVDCTWDDGNGANTYFCLPNAAIEAAPSHECEKREHVGTDYSMSYLYQNGLLDSKVSSVKDKIQQQFDLGVYEFIFSPQTNLAIANGNGWNDAAVEFALLEMILAEVEYTAGGETIVPEIVMNMSANTVTVVAQGPEIDIPEDEEPEDPDEVFTFSASSDNSYHTIVAYTGTARRVVIPEGVEVIESNAFENCTTVQEIVFPDSVTTIWYRAFKGCTNLRSVTLPAGLTHLYGYAFDGCTNLTSVTLPDTLTNLGYYVFQDCTALTAVHLPNSIISIGIGVFQNCYSLKTLTLPSGITSIPSYLCLSCTSLESIELPSGVKSVGYRAFDGCTSLASLTLNEGLETIDDHVFGSLAITELMLPSTLRSVGTFTFQQCPNLKRVTVPSSMTEIPTGCFYNCPELETVLLSEGLTSIGVNAFNYCQKLTNIKLPRTLTSLGTYTFSNCSSLTQLDLYSAATQIAEHTFSGTNCLLVVDENSVAHTFAVEKGMRYSLRKYTNLPAGIVTISTEAFLGSAVQNVIIPDGAVTISSGAFRNCSSLETVTIPMTVTAIADDAFQGCSSFTILCPADSTAAAFAEANDIPCILQN